jgi:hypothetical protein
VVHFSTVDNNCLGEYRTNVRKNGQAVTLYYNTWPDVDIVPVYRTTNDDGTVRYYNIPDMNREVWLPSQPKLHAERMTKKNDACGPGFKRIVKMIKWWNYQHSSLLQSFHIEVLALKAFDNELGDYSWDVFQFFEQAINLGNSSLWYDFDYVDSYLTFQVRQEILKRLQTAKEKSRDAWYKTYGTNSDHKGAIEIWQQIFGDEFPAYGS